ncbi:MAG TPA: hypothetical protein VK661_12220 [Planctomycetota bacterium]|nr:hypothetical protein [Planctomycetota bacterium]
MQDDGSAKGVNSSLEKHWEKIAVGVVLAVLVVYIGVKLFGEGQGATRVITQLRDKLAVQLHQKNDKVSPPAPLIPPTNPPAVNPLSPQPFTVGVKTQQVVNFRPITVAETSFLFPDIRMDQPTVDIEGVTIFWTLLVPTPDPALKQAVVKLDTMFFQVDRRVKGAKDWDTLEKQLKLKDLVKDLAKEKDPKEFKLKYSNKNLQPKTDYEFQITLGSVDPAWQSKQPKLLTGKIAGPVSVRTYGLFEYNEGFSNIQGEDPEPDTPKPAQVWVKIIKYDPECGKVEWSGSCKVGDTIGFSRDKETGAVTSIHRVRSDKKRGQVPVDFNTGAKIKAILTNQVKLYTYKACNPTTEGCSGPKEIKADYKVNRVIYTDEDGVEQTYESLAGMGPRADYFCELHGGVAPRAPTPEDKETALEAKTQELLDKAEKLWKSDKVSEKASAQKIYKELLLPPYADTQAVKAHKGEIETRSKENLKEKPK